MREVNGSFVFCWRRRQRRSRCQRKKHKRWTLSRRRAAQHLPERHKIPPSGCCSSKSSSSSSVSNELIPTYKDCVTPPSEHNPLSLCDTEPGSLSVATAFTGPVGSTGPWVRTRCHYRSSNQITKQVNQCVELQGRAIATCACRDSRTGSNATAKGGGGRGILISCPQQRGRCAGPMTRSRLEDKEQINGSEEYDAVRFLI